MKEIKSITSFLYNNTGVLFPGLLFIICIVMHFSLIIKNAGDGKFFLYQEDEVIYYCSAKVFSETNSVQAEGCIDENVSRIGNMNWYGPGYSIVYGLVFKIIGNYPAVFPWFHFVLAMSMLGLFFLLPISLESRLLAATALSVTEHFCVYIYTYFPETLILFLATILTLLLTLLHNAKDDKSRRIYLIAFVSCALLFMLCRITFIFWLAGLIGLANDRRSLLIGVGIFFTGVALSLVYMKLFTAPPFAGQMHKIDLLFAGELMPFIRQTRDAFRESFNSILEVDTTGINLLLGLIVVCCIVYLFNRSKLILAAMLITLCLLGVMFSYYTVADFYFVKQTAMLIPIIIVSLIATTNSRLASYGLVLILLLIFPVSYRKTDQAIIQGRYGYEHFNNNKAFEKALSEIPDHIQDQSTVILYCYREYDYGYAAEALLPFSTRAKEPILYTTNITDPNADPQTKFQLHNRLKIDYILSRHPIPWPNLQEVHATEFYHLYKLTVGLEPRKL